MLKMPIKARNDTGYLWRNVPFSTLSGELLKKCYYASQGKVFNQLDAFMEWINKVTTDGLLNEWNIALAGGIADENETNVWKVNSDCAVKKIVRNSKVRAQQEGVITVGVVRYVRDLIIDVDDMTLTEETRNKLTTKNYISGNYFKIRNEAGLGKNPLLIIYVIDKDSTPKDITSTTRAKLNAPADIVSFSIVIPGDAINQKTARQLQIKPRPRNGEVNNEA